MTYYIVQFISWLIRLLIFQRVSQYSLKIKSLLFILFGIILVDYFYYAAIFWGEIFILPLIALSIKYKMYWNWTQYFFYTFFSIAFNDILMRISTLYFQFVSGIPYEELIQFFWAGWISIVLIPIFYIGFFYVSKIDIEVIYDGPQTNKLDKTVILFNISLIFYSLMIYILASVGVLEASGILHTHLDNIYYQRLVLFLYLPVFLGFLFYINYIVKLEKDTEIQRIKDMQLMDLAGYSSHVESLYREIRSFRHDYSNLLISLNESIKSKDMSTIQMIYDTVLASSGKRFKHSKYDIAHLSNLKNVAMKSIVSAKLIEAQSYGINLNIEVEESIEEPNSIELVEFLQLISIFLDNAIEAALETPIPRLSFAYFEEDSQKIIVIENSIKNDSIDTKNIFKEGYSTKGPDRGIGLSNVNEILRRNRNITLKTYSQNYLFKQELNILEK